MSRTIEIKGRSDGAVLFAFEATDEQHASDKDMRHALEAAAIRRADLRDADLRGANLSRFRDDVWAVLSSAPAEASAVLAALQAGRVDGTVYLGDCACLVGTIAKARGCHHTALGVLKPDGLRLAETWFMQIRPGHTPANNGPTRLAAEWVGEWLASMRSAFGAQPSDGSQA